MQDRGNPTERINFPDGGQTEKKGGGGVGTFRRCPSPVEDDRKIRECLEQLEKYQWIAFTSPSGVKIFFEFLKKNGRIFGLWEG